ncbi:MAG: DNA recombination protein RmuC [Alcanivorax sp.]|nr:MAG: DNA recombination protein RmuC [Alcanivorax sp.]
MPLVIALGGLLLGLVLGLALGLALGHFRAQAALQKLRSDGERERALQQQSSEQQVQKLAQLEALERDLKLSLEQARQQLGEAQRGLAQAEEQGRHHQQLQHKLAATEQTVVELQNELRREHGQVTDLRARLEASQKETQEKLQLLQEAKEQMKLEFQSIAHKLFEDKSEKFTQQNKSNMGEILNPLKDQLSEFKKKVEDVYDKESRDRVSLLQEIVSLKELNTRMSADALNLTKALKGDSKAQGNWGEMVLEKVLEASGLQKGREYETQGSFSNEDGQRLRPDVVVHLPENKHVVIDSKVSLTAWERFSSETEEQQELQLRAHIESIRAHIKDLSAKNYQDLYGINTPDYVLMFIPIEPAFLKALETDARLFGDAFDKNIMLVCPSTLLVTLKTIHNIWRFEYQNRNALEIARQAGALHDQFVLFAEALEDIGDKLDKAQRAYETAHKRLSSGKGNLVGRIQRLETLGAKARKSIPETLRLDSEEEEEV